MIGIYKIINPKGYIYIGQSINIESRWNKYRYCDYSYDDNKLYRSLRKYGYDQHIFEIIEICSEIQLDEREIYWIEFYNSCCTKYPDNMGLNIEPGGNKPPRRPIGYKMSEESKKIISEKAKQRHVDGRYDELKERRKKSIKPKKEKVTKVPKIPKVKVYKTKEEISKKIKDRLIKHYASEAGVITKQKQSKSFWNNRDPVEYSETLSKRYKGRISPMKGKKQTPLHRDALKKVQESLKKKVIQMDIGGNYIKEWNSLSDIKNELGFNIDHISLFCKGKRKDMSQYRGFIWKFKNDKK